MKSIDVVKTLCGIEKTIDWYLENRAWCEHASDGNCQGERLGLVTGE